MKENSIEEDIILLKDFTEGNFKRDKLENYKGSYKMGYFYYKDIQQAIEHLLSDYKKLQKKNEKYKQFFDLMLRLDSDYFMNCGDEETIKLVDEILKLESE